MIRGLLLWLLQKLSAPDEEELGHLALCAWNGWVASAKTRAEWDTWNKKSPHSHAAWKRVVRAIVAHHAH